MLNLWGFVATETTSMKQSFFSKQKVPGKSSGFAVTSGLAWIIKSILELRKNTSHTLAHAKQRAIKYPRMLVQYFNDKYSSLEGKAQECMRSIRSTIMNISGQVRSWRWYNFKIWVKRNDDLLFCVAPLVLGVSHYLVLEGSQKKHTTAAFDRKQNAWVKLLANGIVQMIANLDKSRFYISSPYSEMLQGMIPISFVLELTEGAATHAMRVATISLGVIIFIRSYILRWIYGPKVLSNTDSRKSFTKGVADNYLKICRQLTTRIEAMREQLKDEKPAEFLTAQGTSCWQQYSKKMEKNLAAASQKLVNTQRSLKSLANSNDKKIINTEVLGIEKSKKRIEGLELDVEELCNSVKLNDNFWHDYAMLKNDGLFEPQSVLEGLSPEIVKSQQETQLMFLEEQAEKQNGNIVRLFWRIDQQGSHKVQG